MRRAGFKVDDPALCPVDEGGYYDANAPEFLRGKRVVTPKTPADDASVAVLDGPEADGRAGTGAILLSQRSSPHSYPHCWRCKNPVIFRATHQWFIDLGALRDRAMSEIRGRVEWIPSYSENRIGAMVDNRLEWTISRQRRWGSPITFLRCVDCKEKGVVRTSPASKETSPDREKRQREDFFERVRETFREHGANAWYDDAFPPSYFLSKSSSSLLLFLFSLLLLLRRDELREAEGHPRRLVRLRRLARGGPALRRLRPRGPVHGAAARAGHVPRGPRPAPRLVPVVAPHVRRAHGPRARTTPS